MPEGVTRPLVRGRSRSSRRRRVWIIPHLRISITSRALADTAARARAVRQLRRTGSPRRPPPLARRMGSSWGAAGSARPAAEEPLSKLAQDALQVSHRDALVDEEALDLVKHRRVRRVVVAPVRRPRRDERHRRGVAGHRANLDVSSCAWAAAQSARRLAPHPEAVLHVRGRVIRREAELREVVFLDLDLRAVVHGEPEADEQRRRSRPGRSRWGARARAAPVRAPAASGRTAPPSGPRPACCARSARGTRRTRLPLPA